MAQVSEVVLTVDMPAPRMIEQVATVQVGFTIEIGADDVGGHRYDVKLYGDDGRPADDELLHDFAFGGATMFTLTPGRVQIPDTPGPQRFTETEQLPVPVLDEDAGSRVPREDELYAVVEVWREFVSRSGRNICELVASARSETVRLFAVTG